MTPHIYRNTIKGLTKNPSWIALTYLGSEAKDEKAENRTAACANCPATSVDPILNSKDEFPFASTFQGGQGAVCAYVPGREQSIQGGMLSVVYRGMQRGDYFIVVPVPSLKIPPPIGVPYPVRPPYNIPAFSKRVGKRWWEPAKMPKWQPSPLTTSTVITALVVIALFILTPKFVF